ncbi:MAG: aconitase family protein [Planctomycetota bacterium]
MSRIAAVLAARAGQSGARPGAALSVSVDRVLLDGLTAESLFGPLIGRDRPAFLQPERFAVFGDGEAPSPQSLAVAAWLRTAGLRHALEPARAGLPGVVGADEGLVSSHDVVVGTTPDVGGLGGLGCVALRVSRQELLGLMTQPRLATNVPTTRVVQVSGRLPRWVSAFDLAQAVLQAANEAADSAGRVPGEVFEFQGATIDALDVPERLALCEALARAGVCAIVPPDARTRAWLAARQITVEEPQKPLETQLSGPSGAGSPQRLEIQAPRVRLTAVLPPAPGRRIPVPDEGGPPVNSALLAGRIEDLRVAADVLRERNVRRGLHLGVLPASQRVLLHAIEEGLIADFLRAGASLLPPGSRPAAAPNRLATLPADPQDLLAGAAVVAASSVAGRLIDPESMRRGHRRRSRLG